MSIIEKASDRMPGFLTNKRITTELMPSPEQSQLKVEVLIPQQPKLDSGPQHAPRQYIDLERLQTMGFITPAATRTKMAEAFRYIKRPLLSKALQNEAESNKHSNLIMVTSARSGEGKTYCAVNLAMSIAMEMDHTVLLVDAAVDRPSVLSTLGLKAETGLIDLLRNESLDFSEVLVKTSIETLSVLPPGCSESSTTELLASQTMRSLLHEIASRYHDRIIIFDAPPLLLASEASVLAEQMGQVVLVVEAERTTQNLVLDALTKLDACANVQLLYNKARSWS